MKKQSPVRKPLIYLHPLAMQDVRETSEFYVRQSPATLSAFLANLNATLKELAQTPHGGAVHYFRDQLLSGIRHWPVKRFRKYLIFYRPLTDNNGIEVIRVLHTARDIQAIFDES